MMRWLLWILRVVLFLFLFAFAIRNTDPVNVRFFLDAAWNAPLVIILLAFFAGGVIFSMLFLFVPLMGRRREVNRLQRELHALRTRRPGTGEHHV
ncbi:LapA family protein [Accumulibacter sp.]|uniref:LapA family protein n=1 Tax=Accumulibacter sp. TaxID=2053492 RepID=UPI0025E2DD7D|nr:LapA family protein [Accumulibacter sp.]